MNKNLSKLLIINLIVAQTFLVTATAQTVTSAPTILRPKLGPTKTQQVVKTKPTPTNTFSKTTTIKTKEKSTVSSAPVPNVIAQKPVAKKPYSEIKLKPQSPQHSVQPTKTPSTKLPQVTSVKSLQPIKKNSNTNNQSIKAIQAVNKTTTPMKTNIKPAVNNIKNKSQSLQPLNKIDTSLTSINYNIVKIVDGKVQDNFLNFISTLNKNGYKVEQINSDYGYIIFNANGNYRYVAVITNAGNNKTAVKITNIDKNNDLLQSDFSKLF